MELEPVAPPPDGLPSEGLPFDPALPRPTRLSEALCPAEHAHRALIATPKTARREFNCILELVPHLDPLASAGQVKARGTALLRLFSGRMLSE